MFPTSRGTRPQRLARRIIRICGTPGGAVAVHSKSGHSLTWLTALVLVCVAGVSPAAIASPGISSRVGRCRSFTVGTAVYTNIRVVGVTCPLAARLPQSHDAQQDPPGANLVDVWRLPMVVSPYRRHDHRDVRHEANHCRTLSLPPSPATFSQDGRARRPLRGSPFRAMRDLRSKRTVSMTMAVLFQIVFARPPVRPASPRVAARSRRLR